MPHGFYSAETSVASTSSIDGHGPDRTPTAGGPENGSLMISAIAEIVSEPLFRIPPPVRVRVAASDRQSR